MCLHISGEMSCIFSYCNIYIAQNKDNTMSVMFQYRATQGLSKLRVCSRPALYKKSQEITFDVIWRYKIKIDLT